MIPHTPILFSGNCGSSWFESLLGAHPDLSTPIYEPLYEASMSVRERWAFLVKHSRSGDEIALAIRNLFSESRLDPWQLGKLKSGAGLVFKIRPNELLPQDLVGPAKAQLIWIRRRNVLKQALSSMKRNELGISQFTRQGVSEPVWVDLEKLDNSLAEVVSMNSLCQDFFRGFDGSKFIVDYENLLQDSQRVLNSVLRRLRLSDLSLRTNYYAKVTSDSLREAVANVDEFCAYCESRGLSWSDS